MEIRKYPEDGKNGRVGYKMDILTFDFIAGNIILLLYIVS